MPEVLSHFEVIPFAANCLPILYGSTRSIKVVPVSPSWSQPVCIQPEASKWYHSLSIFCQQLLG